MTRRVREPASQLSRMKGFGFRVYQYGERGSVGDAQQYGSGGPSLCPRPA